MQVVFYKKGEEPFAIAPRLSVVGDQPLIEVIDLPPQETVTRHLRVLLPTSEVDPIDNVKTADKVKLLADIPGGERV